MSKKIVFFNSDHIEGQIAAWLGRRAMGDEIEFIGLGKGSKLPDVTGREVVFAGVSVKRDQMLQIQKDSHTFEAFENDLAAQSEVLGIKNAKFDTKKTAARFLCDHFKRAFTVTVGGHTYNTTGDSWFIDFSIDAFRHKWPKVDRPMLAYGVFDVLEKTKDAMTAFDLLSVMDPEQVVQHGRDAIAADQVKHTIGAIDDKQQTKQTSEGHSITGGNANPPKAPRASRGRKPKISTDAPSH